jgi:hypothetical protein
MEKVVEVPVSEEEPETKNYIDNREFLNELKKLKDDPELTEKLHLMFFDLATNYAHIKSFRNYSYIKDMVVEGYINCVIVANKFDTEKYSNPFAYFTTVVHRNFLNFIAKEKKQQSRKWRELKVLYEKYMVEDGVKLNLPDNVLEKMYADPEKSPSKKAKNIDMTPEPVHEELWEKDEVCESE